MGLELIASWAWKISGGANQHLKTSVDSGMEGDGDLHE